MYCWHDLNKDAASGVDGLTAETYARNLEANITDLAERVKAKRYRAKLVRRVLIPKENGQQRPLGIPALEDKLVQLACATLSSAIHEQDFLDCSYGYRPGRSAKQAVIELDLQTVRRRLEQRFTLIPDILPGGGPARYFRLGATETRIGFITPISQHFCETCNRVRLTVDGTLYLCLGQESSYALRPLLRDGIGDDELIEHLKQAIALKPERHEFNERPEKVIRFMSMTGG